MKGRKGGRTRRNGEEQEDSKAKKKGIRRNEK